MTTAAGAPSVGGLAALSYLLQERGAKDVSAFIRQPDPALTPELFVSLSNSSIQTIFALLPHWGF